MHRKDLLFGVLIGFLLMLMAGCAAVPSGTGSGTDQAHAGGNTKRAIRIAHQNDAQILIGQAKGWFDEEFSRDGTEVVFTRFVAGPPIMEAFSAGRQDVGTAGDMPPVAARSSGVGVQVIGIAGRTQTGNTVVVRADSSIHSVQNLKGRKLAAQVGSSQYHYALLLLEQKGLKDEVSVVNIQLTELGAALEAGTVDAIVGNERLAGTLVHKGIGRVLPDSRGIKPGLSLYVARTEFIEEHPDLVERFLKVMKRINDYIQANPEEAAVLAEELTDYASPVMQQIFQDTTYDLRIRPEDVQQLEVVRDFLLATDVIKRDYPISELIEPTYAEAAES